MPPPASLIFNSKTGYLYAFEWTDAWQLDDTAWLIMSNNIVGTDDIYTVYDEDSSGSRIYRIRAWPAP